ncbi:MAG: hypothetical protein ACYC2H_13375 [Thermoplasmatota archaeon]
MPSRADMDRPASVTAAVLGVVLIGITIPYFVFGGGAGETEYAIGWSEATSGTGQAPNAAAGSPAEATVTVTDGLPSTAIVEFPSCNDGATTPLQQQASITWTLFEGTEQKGQGTASCDNAGPFPVAIDPAPDVASMSAGSADEAVEKAYDAASNETATFRLVFTWTRGGGLPIGPQPAFSTTGTLEIQEWRATANVPDAEAPR